MTSSLPPAKKALLELEKGNAWPVYFLYGEEPFKIREFVARVLELAFKGAPPEFSIDRIDGSSATGAEVLNAVMSLGLFGGGGAGDSCRRVVLVRQAQLLKELKPLETALMDADGASPWGDSILILAADRLDGRFNFHKWLKKRGYAIEFEPAVGTELVKWALFLAKRAGARLDDAGAAAAAMVSDGSLDRLAREIEKAWLHAGGTEQGEVTEADVLAVGCGQRNHEMIDLVRAILEGRRARAMLLLDRLVRDPRDAQPLVGFLVWAIKNPGRGTPALATSEAHSFLWGLIELDERLKTSGLEAKSLVEQFVIERTKAAS